MNKLVAIPAVTKVGVVAGLLSLTCLTVFPAYADTLVADSCDRQHVQSKIDVASDGDIVMIPTGSCTWSSSVTISDQGIVLQGAGIGQTTISTAGTAVDVTGAQGKPFRITAMTFQGGGTSEKTILVSGDCQNFRIDNIAFLNISAHAVYVRGDTFGVIDHCTVEANGQALFFEGGNPRGHYLYSLDPGFGTANAVYVEDCILKYIGSDPGGSFCHNVIEWRKGAKIVLRHSTVTDHDMGNHGICFNQFMRGAYTYEVYNNTWDLDTIPICTRWLNIRGGTGVAFGNTIHTGFNKGIELHNYRTCLGDGITSCDGMWDRCDGNSLTGFDGFHDGNSGEDSTGDLGTHTGSDNQTNSLTDSTKSWTADQWAAFYVWNTTTGKETCRARIASNTSDTLTLQSALSCDDFDDGDGYKITNGYPCFDQIGRANDGNGDGIQDLVPLYEWENRYTNGTDVDQSVYEVTGCDKPSYAEHIKKNRDYFNDTQMPGYVAYTYPHPLTQGGGGSGGASGSGGTTGTGGMGGGAGGSTLDAGVGASAGANTGAGGQPPASDSEQNTDCDCQMVGRPCGLPWQTLAWLAVAAVWLGRRRASCGDLASPR